MSETTARILLRVLPRASTTLDPVAVAVAARFSDWNW